MAERASEPCIVGVGETDYAKRGRFAGRGELSLACEAIKRAASDAGIAPREIDGFASFGGDSVAPAELQKALAMPHLRASAMAWHPGGGGSCGAVALAAALVTSGQAECVAVFRSIIQRPERRYGQARGSYRALASLNEPFGIFAPATQFALLARRHMHLYGTTSEQLGAVAVAARTHALRNSRAVMKSPMTLADHQSSRMIADPLHLFDCCVETDGAAALLVMRREKAADLSGDAVVIAATGVGSDPSWGAGIMGDYNVDDAVYASGNARGFAKDLFARAGLAPGDIDVAQFYDAFTIMVLLALEDFGFCEPGESGSFVASGGLSWPDGPLPSNTAGGLLSEAYMQGLNHVIEGVRQLRGRSTVQVSEARTCFVCGGPAEGPTSALILMRADQ